MLYVNWFYSGDELRGVKVRLFAPALVGTANCFYLGGPPVLTHLHSVPWSSHPSPAFSELACTYWRWWLRSCWWSTRGDVAALVALALLWETCCVDTCIEPAGGLRADLVVVVVIYEVIGFLGLRLLHGGVIRCARFARAEICVDLRGHVSTDGDAALAPGTILQRDEEAGDGHSWHFCVHFTLLQSELWLCSISHLLHQRCVLDQTE